jgi:type II secretory pathway pseudopilin PulG
MKFDKIKKLKTQNGSLLLELLIVISLIAIIVSVSANATFLSMKSNKASGNRDNASALASETLEATRSVIEEDWQNIYGLTKSTQHYYPTSTYVAGKWSLRPTVIPTDEQVVINGVTYTRYLTVDNVSRDSTTRNIQNIYSSADDDPSTQKVTVIVSWPAGETVTISEYFFRWKNKVCGQPGWTTQDANNTLVGCAGTSYYTKDTGIDLTTTPGSIQLK